MNILFYNGSLRMGGAEKILVEILKGIEKKDKKIKLVISDESISENFYEDDIPKEIELKYLIPNDLIEKTKRYKAKKHKIIDKILYNYFMLKEQNIKLKKLKNIIKNKKYDIVVDFDMGLSKNIDLIDAKIKVAWIHSPIDKWYKKKLRIKRLGERLKKYDLLITICDDMKIVTKNLYPFLENKIIKIYNPFDIKEILRKSELIDNYSKDKKILLEDDYLISVGRLDNYSKDYLTLLKGYKICLERGIREKLYILGDGPEYLLLKKWISDLKIEDNVILLGRDKNPYPWIKNAKLFIHSSRFEGLPTVLIEALICKTPIISSDCPTGPREILEDEHYGMLYKVGNYNELSEKICFLLGNEEKYKEYEDLASIRGKEFSKEKSISKIEKLLKGEYNELF